MRTVSEAAAVRLYHLDDEGGVATTILYGTLAEAMAAAAREPAEVQAGLYLQTSNDVVGYLDLLEG
ncbi:hypothetical protein ASE73_08655 [Sphingomonas sp. Leaf24]|uniref:hypothetical protein n=1 Tax=unclassified Sphingomonas TaxID=196159 RepID=UPI000700CDC2|nr:MULTISPECIES: hypothetical protein [unclassified Sphingomonas]KQM18110.1 hypothetical protein ASE50_06695 [Sphingomonas sp. Leaf5]KQM77526.1 hypothetical protein ASE70_06425 [Sphingomonas sp. Leaf22]KQM89091.1 hypothetical protein ASE73_08655 [Sphingomonas sp. Leaf24]